MYPEVLTARARQLLPKLGRLLAASGFYLAGGTALALQYGHRRSADFDFFSRRTFKTQNMREGCARLGAFRVIGEDRGTLHGAVAGVRLTFLHYPYRLLWPAIRYGTLRLADPRDIACMKMQAVSSRGSRKDFFDMYELLQRYSLDDVLRWFDKKYGRAIYNHLHLLKSLTYFTEAEAEPNPRLLHAVSWSTVRRSMREAVTAYLKK